MNCRSRFSQLQKITCGKQIAISGENQFTEVMSLNFIAKLQMMNSINFFPSGQIFNIRGQDVIYGKIDVISESK